MSGHIVAVIGAGLIGRSWAISFARAGHHVRLYDRDPAAIAAACAFAAEALAELASHDLLGGQMPEEVLARIGRATSLAAALDGCSHAQENGPEDLATRTGLFAELDRAAPPGAVLASSTSSLVPSSFTERLAGRARCLVAHPINPPHLIPAVELVPAPWTSETTLDRAHTLFRGMGHSIVRLRREHDAFVVNRLQGALLEEAFRLVAEGVCEVEDVDVALRDGLALRWSFMGPFETIDLNAPGGVRDYVRRYEAIYRRLFGPAHAEWGGETLQRIERQRRARLAEPDLPARAAWRDRRLMALLRHKRETGSGE